MRDGRRRRNGDGPERRLRAADVPRFLLLTSYFLGDGPERRLRAVDVPRRLVRVALFSQLELTSYFLLLTSYSLLLTS